MPRSRTAWLANWLSRATGASIGHDLAIWADSIDDWLEHLWRCRRGTVETGAVEAWPILRRSIPQARIAVIKRALWDVQDALEAAGFPAPRCVLERRWLALDALSEQTDVLTLQHTQLDEPEHAAALHQHCLGGEMNAALYQEMRALRITVDRDTRLRVLTERHDRIEAVKDELRARLAEHKPWVTVGAEPWGAVADECDALGAEHHAEAAGGVEGNYRLNKPLMAQMAQAGMLASIIARVDGRVAGYCLWTTDTNAESDAPPRLLQGPFYAKPEHAVHHLGRRMLDFSRVHFASLGIRCLRLHHTVYGRGARAGALYEALGAVEHQREYHLAIGA